MPNRFQAFLNFFLLWVTGPCFLVVVLTSNTHPPRPKQRTAEACASEGFSSGELWQPPGCDETLYQYMDELQTCQDRLADACKYGNACPTIWLQGGE